MQNDEIKPRLLKQISNLHQEKRLSCLVNDREDYLQIEEEEKSPELFALPQVIFYDKNHFVTEELRH